MPLRWKGREIGTLERRHDSIMSVLAEILNNTRAILMADQDTLDLISQLNDETTAIGTRIEGLLGTISTSMTPAEVSTVNAGLTAEVARLKALATDPAAPVPTTPPATPPAAPTDGGTSSSGASSTTGA